MKLLKSGTILRSKLKHVRQYLEATPRPTENDFEKLYNDIKNKGQIKPICVDQNFEIIDGYTRDEILGKLRTGEINYDQFHFETEDEKLDYINSMNVKRRHLNEWQKFQAAKSTYEKIKQEAKQRQKTGTSASKDAKGKAAALAAKEAGMSTSTFERALVVDKKATPEIKKKLENSSAKIKTVYSQVTRKERNLPKARMPEGKFDVILADVPIQFHDQGVRGAADHHYSTMTAEDICKLNVPAAENAVCFFWMSPSIAFSEIPKEYKTGRSSLMINIPIYKLILNSWGFTEIKNAFVWDKEIIGPGSWLRNQHENCFIAIKGKMPVPAELFSSVIREKRSKHSKKPEKLYDMIEKMYPKRSYIELFARKKYSDKWEVYGNEINETTLQDKCKCGHTRILHNGDEHERSCVYGCGCENFAARKRRKQIEN